MNLKSKMEVNIKKLIAEHFSTACLHYFTLRESCSKSCVSN